MEEHKHAQQIDCCHDSQPVTGPATAHSHDEDHEHDHGNAGSFKTYLPAILSLVLLLSGIALDYFKVSFFESPLRIIYYLISYVLVAWPVLKEAAKTFAKADFFTEFSLMSIATLGALVLGEYPEAVAVMLFYTIGELFQQAAVNKAKRNIKALLDVRPDIATVIINGKAEVIKPEKVEIGAVIQVKVGEKLPLDGKLLSEKAVCNTAALTGESRPKTLNKGENVLAGMVNLDGVITLEVTKKFEDTSLSRILEMVQEASARKAKTELFIRRLARIYTPIVFFLAVALVVVPYFVVADYQFKQWLYRALVFLVISCPCALVISIPLGYFGGIGAASAKGILFKGSNYLDLVTKLNNVVFDKTGTLTEGVFEVKSVHTSLAEQEFLKYLASIESQSNHPIAKAITAGFKGDLWVVENLKEISGKGLQANVNGKKVIAGNVKLLDMSGVQYPLAVQNEVETTVLMAIDNAFVGYVLIADQIKPDAKLAIDELRGMGVSQLVMLSGDKDSITQKTAQKIGLDKAYGGLLPEDKAKHVEQLKAQKNAVTAFVGDGINDAPVLALADVGIAMGAMGSDAAIETADVVIQNDQPSKVAIAIKIGKATKKVVYQNIGLAFGVKAIVLILGAGGLATMWEAVFADVGVAFVAILNAVRIQRMKF